MSPSATDGDRPTSINSAHVGRVPVRNLWLLMFYASDLFRARGSGNTAQEDSPDDIPDLVAEILAHAVEQRQRRYLSVGYQPRHDVTHRVRGRIDFLTTECRQLLSHGRVACRFEELSIDTPRNRFVRAALERISRLATNENAARRCRTLVEVMKTLGVGGAPPTRAAMTADRFGRHDADDRLMVAAAKLAFDLALPNEESGNSVLPLPDRDERWVRRLFERAIGGFYEVVLGPQGWRVLKGQNLYWRIERKTPKIDRILPNMRTDIKLEHRSTSRRIVIDTKFNSILASGWYRDETLRSGYLYQMYAYLQSQSGCGETAADHAEGLLLHPCTGPSIDEAVVIQGHLIRFATVDLAGSSSTIRHRLLDVIQPVAEFTKLQASCEVGTPAS